MTHRHACFAEAFASYCLVLAGTGAIVTDALTGGVIGHAGIALTFGMVVMVMIYAVGDVSGAHLNPAVTIAFAIAKRFSWKQVPGYLMAQTTGSLSASATVWALIGTNADLGSTLPIETDLRGWLRCFGLEVIFTWMLMLVILGVSTGGKEKGLMAGIAIGGTVGLLAMFGGPLTGASMNPARSFAPALLAGIPVTSLVYIAATPIGALFAVWTLCLIRPADCCPGGAC
ncbi:MAG: aquaporin [Planctomycetota bacterium]|jgi:aquaporin NIP|nr:aquaporin [Planctomycetota bacterium]